MPWRAVSVVDSRREFVTLAEMADLSLSELCRRFRVSRKAGYKWLRRFREYGEDGLEDRSRRPNQIRDQLPQDQQQAIVALRRRYPRWGARKIRRRLQDLGLEALPACSSITGVLHRHGLIDENAQGKGRPFKRFEQQEPNMFWQTDFKGPVARRLAGREGPSSDHP
jgi:transposase